MVELVQARRTPEESSREFEPPAQAIHNWVKPDEVDEGVRSNGLKTSGREEVPQGSSGVRVPSSGSSGRS
jgi:transposase